MPVMGTPTHNSWMNMRERCAKPTAQYYRYYGGRGITICERWNSFANFLADMGPRPDGMSLDRIDNDGNYEPGNCRWADILTQNRNRSSVFNHKSHCVNGHDVSILGRNSKRTCVACVREVYPLRT